MVIWIIIDIFIGGVFKFVFEMNGVCLMIIVYSLFKGIGCIYV